MAKCSKCDSSNNLFVWYIPDPYNDYPLLPEVICDQCPKPTDIFKDSKARYNPDFHDHVLGLQDYYVGLAYSFHGPNDVKGLCLECDKEVNMSKGYGRSYLPDEYRMGDMDTVVYCQDCYRTRCKNHINFEQKEELEKLSAKLGNYSMKTDNGQLIF